MKLGVVRYARSFARISIALATAEFVRRSWRVYRRQAKPHKLPGSLTVTLTSYPPRFPTLELTLKSLLAQSVLPDRLILWIAENDRASLPENVRDLESNGLQIRFCEDLRSYKKLLPALSSYADDFLVIADDDVYYRRHWLRDFVREFRPGVKEVLSARAHRMRLDERGMPLPYSQWESTVKAGDASKFVFPTGIGGVLYSPGIFHPDVTRLDIARSLCPTNDDIWLYWMALLNGATFRKVGPRKRMITWEDSQTVSLFATNVSRNANDEQINRMIAHYGFPANEA